MAVAPMIFVRPVRIVGFALAPPYGQQAGWAPMGQQAGWGPMGQQAG